MDLALGEPIQDGINTCENLPFFLRVVNRSPVSREILDNGTKARECRGGDMPEAKR